MGESTTTELLRLEKTRALADFYWFAKHVFGWRDMQPHAHAELCEALQGMDSLKAKGEGQAELLVLMPRGTFKSSIAAQAFPLWYLLHNPDARILISSATSALATSNMLAIRAVITENRRFRELFGDRVARDSKGKPLRWNLDEIMLSGRSSYGKQLKEASITVGAIGKIKTGQHYDVMIMDDIVNHENSDTPEQNAKVVRYHGQCQSILEDDGFMVDVGTRYKYDDLWGRILELGLADRVILKKAIQEDGSLFFPEKLSHETLKRLRKKQGPYMFSCQYMNEPTNRESQVFMEEYLRRYDKLPDGCTKFLLVDPSRGESVTSDYSACVVVAVDEHENYYVESAEQRRVRPSQLIDWIYDLHRFHKFDRISVEQVGMQTLVDMIHERHKMGQPFIPVQAAKTTNTKSKPARIRMMEPYFANGKVFLKRGSGMDILITMLLRFPNITKDDLIDALSMFVEHTYPPNKETKKEKYDDPWAPIARAPTPQDRHRRRKPTHWLRWTYD